MIKRAGRRVAPSFVRGDRLSNGTQIKITFAESREKNGRFPSAVSSLSRWPRRKDKQARKMPGKRKVRHDRRRWPARRLSGSLTPFENTLLITRRYVLHTPPRAVLRLGDALVYFAHRRHHCSSSSSSVSSSSTRR